MANVIVYSTSTAPVVVITPPLPLKLQRTLDRIAARTDLGPESRELMQEVAIDTYWDWDAYPDDEDGW